MKSICKNMIIGSIGKYKKQKKYITHYICIDIDMFVIFHTLVDMVPITIINGFLSLTFKLVKLVKKKKSPLIKCYPMCEV